MVRVAETSTGEQVWRALTSASFALLSHVTPTGEPRSSGVVYAVADRRLTARPARDAPPVPPGPLPLHR